MPSRPPAPPPPQPPRPQRRLRSMLEDLEPRLLCKLAANGDFVITPPGGGVGHATIHEHPVAGVIGLNTAEANSNGVVNWQRTD